MRKIMMEKNLEEEQYEILNLVARELIKAGFKEIEIKPHEYAGHRLYVDGTMVSGFLERATFRFPGVYGRNGSGDYSTLISARSFPKSKSRLNTYGFDIKKIASHAQKWVENECIRKRSQIESDEFNKKASKLKPLLDGFKSTGKISFSLFGNDAGFHINIVTKDDDVLNKIIDLVRDEIG